MLYFMPSTGVIWCKYMKGNVDGHRLLNELWFMFLHVEQTDNLE